MKTISAFVSALVFTAAVAFAAPTNGTIEVAKTAVSGDSVVTYTPIDWGQYSSSDTKWRITSGDKWSVWIVFDKDNNSVIEPGKDVSVLLNGVLTVDGNYIRAAFVPPAGYKGHVMWSAYQVQADKKVNIWVNVGYHNRAGVPKDPSGYTDNNGLSVYHLYL